MSLPDVSFTNNLGTVTLKRCVVGVTDSWQWDGRGVRRSKAISVTGYVKQGVAAERLDGVLTSTGTDGKRAGGTGTLALPWTTLSHIKLTDIDWPDGQWIDMKQVSLSFLDETPMNNRYTFTLLGYTLFNPKLTVPIPTRPLGDDYPQMRWSRGTFLPFDPRSGYFRTRGSEKNLDVQLGGTIQVPDVKLPTNLLQQLQMRVGLNTALPSPSNLPPGYPQPFNLGDAVPELKDDMNLAHCIVAGGQVQWNVEQQLARVSLNIICPPQRLGRT